MPALLTRCAAGEATVVRLNYCAEDFELVKTCLSILCKFASSSTACLEMEDAQVRSA